MPCFGHFYPLRKGRSLFFRVVSQLLSTWRLKPQVRHRPFRVILLIQEVCAGVTRIITYRTSNSKATSLGSISKYFRFPPALTDLLEGPSLTVRLVKKFVYLNSVCMFCFPPLV
jgi:hypothetical protein